MQLCCNKLGSGSVWHTLIRLALIIVLPITKQQVGERHEAPVTNQPFESGIAAPHEFEHQGFLTMIITLS